MVQMCRGANVSTFRFVGNFSGELIATFDMYGYEQEWICTRVGVEEGEIYINLFLEFLAR